MDMLLRRLELFSTNSNICFLGTYSGVPSYLQNVIIVNHGKFKEILNFCPHFAERGASLFGDCMPVSCRN